ncbi:hypothetical protein EYC58_02705 [Candidatus Saccharibacteria bacterium]|nr:MAG: hypothetical protein EYC58_02705 [Candidatus Saccharibacteria bacterium]
MPEEKNTEPKKRPWLKIILIAAAAVVVVLGSYAGYVYAVSPAVIRAPKLEHYHFRMQILVNGKAEDFGSQAYQTGYAKDQCNANLPEQPIHFHDNKDQFTHIHWEGMTGGMVMKYYGWNFIGGMDNALGYKLDDLKDIQKVTTHGDYLPEIPKDATFYVYTGNESGYKLRNFDDWKNQDLEQFFGVTSNSPAHDINKNGGEQASLLDSVFPKAYAHGTEDHSSTSTPSANTETEEQKLTRINNLLGNVVIFVQTDKPTDEQIKARFNQLEPLTDSTCGG